MESVVKEGVIEVKSQFARENSIYIIVPVVKAWLYWNTQRRLLSASPLKMFLNKQEIVEGYSTQFLLIESYSYFGVDPVMQAVHSV